MLRKFAAATAVIAVSACTTGPSVPPAGSTPPVAYREAVAARVRDTFFDPYSVRDAVISEPFYATQVFDGSNVIGYEGWLVCIRSNAKNRFGAYAGQTFTAMLFQNGTITHSISGQPAALEVIRRCSKMQMTPFPEIEQSVPS